MKTEVVLDFKRITAQVAARHGMLVSQDDPAMLLVTMNEVVLQQVFGNIEARTEEIVAGIEATFPWRNAKRWAALKERRGKPGSPYVRRFKRILTLGDCTREN